MARKTVGSVTKTKDGRNVIKISQDVSLKSGQYLNLENEASALARVDYMLQNSIIDEAAAEKARAAIAKTPYVRDVNGKKEGFVLFQVVLKD